MKKLTKKVIYVKFHAGDGAISSSGEHQDKSHTQVLGSWCQARVKLPFGRDVMRDRMIKTN